MEVGTSLIAQWAAFKDCATLRTMHVACGRPNGRRCDNIRNALLSQNRKDEFDDITPAVILSTLLRLGGVNGGGLVQTKARRALKDPLGHARACPA